MYVLTSGIEEKKEEHIIYKKEMQNVLMLCLDL